MIEQRITCLMQGCMKLVLAIFILLQFFSKIYEVNKTEMINEHQISFRILFYFDLLHHSVGKTLKITYPNVTQFAVIYAKYKI